MQKEILKGFTMLALIVTLALATAVVSANAQSKTIVANVPFDFVVGSQAMPSGKYITNPATSDGRALMIQSADAKNAVIRLANTIQRKGSRTNARLVFHRYGDRYFLAEVWNGGDSTGLELLKSRQERALQHELASISPKNEPGQSLYEIVEVVAVLR
jgi:hypothetical protein